MICPKCRQNRARRAERVNFVDNALNQLFFKPWLCQNCQYRFHAIREDLGPQVLRLRIATRLQSVGRKNKKRNRRELYIYGFAAALLAVLIYSLMQQRSPQ